MAPVVSTLAGVHRLPPELLSLLFHHTLGAYWLGGRHGPYMKTLFHLCSVCRFWRDVARTTASLWCNLETSSNMDPEMTSHILALSGQSALHLKVVLSLRPKWPHHAVLKAVCDHLPRASVLAIHCHSINGAKDKVAALDGVSLSAVENIQVEANISGSVHLVRSVGALVNELDLVRSIRLRHVGIQWDLSHTLSRLQVMVLRDIDIHFTPEWRHWKAISLVAPAMERICLRNIGCSGVPDVAEMLDFPMVTHLDLSFRREKASLFQLVSAFRLVALTSLKVVANSSDALTSLKCNDNLRNVSQIAIWIANIDTLDLHDFFRATPLLQQLDALTSDQDVLAALVIRTESSPLLPATIVCPALTSIAVTTVNPIQLRSFLEARQSVAAMDHVMFRQGFPEGTYYERDLQWLQSRMAVGARAAPFDAAWITSVFEWGL
ncbi:hypothetical protein C8R47DRAFT_1294404 [Mycena vitilis]|nr:hypothetical protein C8R47DRAFT_1294404 [Mycena vitilis]